MFPRLPSIPILNCQTVANSHSMDGSSDHKLDIQTQLACEVKVPRKKFFNGRALRNPMTIPADAFVVGVLPSPITVASSSSRQ
jgi:hypothetical protein